MFLFFSIFELGCPPLHFLICVAKCVSEKKYNEGYPNPIFQYSSMIRVLKPLLLDYINRLHLTTDICSANNSKVGNGKQKCAIGPKLFNNFIIHTGTSD